MYVKQPQSLLGFVWGGGAGCWFYFLLKEKKQNTGSHSLAWPFTTGRYAFTSQGLGLQACATLHGFLALVLYFRVAFWGLFLMHVLLHEKPYFH